MDTARIAHIGVESVVLIGVVVYLNSQNAALKREIKDLRTRLEQDRDSNIKHFNTLYGLMDETMRKMAVRSLPVPDPEPPKPAPLQLRSRKKPALKVVEEKKPDPPAVESLDDEISEELKTLEEDNTDEAEPVPDPLVKALARPAQDLSFVSTAIKAASPSQKK